jgi:amidophosphoribosyltransferase
VLDPIHDECGVAAVYLMGKLPGEERREASDPAVDPGEREAFQELLQRSYFDGGYNAAYLIPPMLTELQNRGQLASGITSFNPYRPRILVTWKDNGSVGEVFRTNHDGKYQAILKDVSGRAAIGHVRYATCGVDDASCAQPFSQEHSCRWKWFAFCFNGNIANYTELKRQILGKHDHHLIRQIDTEIIQHHLHLALEGHEKPEFTSVFRRLARTFDGAYSIAILTADGDLVVGRDPFGFRPLCFGVKDKLFVAASESHPLDSLGFERHQIRSVEPGTFVHVNEDGWRVERFADSPRKAYCFFEWVYFSNVNSVLNERSVYLSRRQMGEALAEREDPRLIDANCVVVPVPDTARAAADAMAAKLGVPTFEGLIRNRYVGRTFIEGTGRKEKALRKYKAQSEILEGKRVFLVEDSIVRSTTLRVIIRMIREKGRAKEVHVRVACPPIMAPCSYGIDMSTVAELFAPKFLDQPFRGEIPAEQLDRLAKDLDADSLRYLSVDALPKCIGLPEKELCMGCLTGKYPTPWGNKLYQVALECRDQVVPEGVVISGQRTYEKALAGAAVDPPKTAPPAIDDA